MTERQDSDTIGRKATDTTDVPMQTDQPTETPKTPQDQHDRSYTVTITISRATAEGWITEAHDTTDRKAVLVALACRAALEGER